MGLSVGNDVFGDHAGGKKITGGRVLHTAAVILRLLAAVSRC